MSRKKRKKEREGRFSGKTERGSSNAKLLESREKRDKEQQSHA